MIQVRTTLRAEASNLGSNLSIVQIRQDFFRDRSNVLQTDAGVYDRASELTSHPY